MIKTWVSWSWMIFCWRMLCVICNEISTYRLDFLYSSRINQTDKKIWHALSSFQLLYTRPNFRLSSTLLQSFMRTPPRLHCTITQDLCTSAFLSHTFRVKSHSLAQTFKKFFVELRCIRRYRDIIIITAGEFSKSCCVWFTNSSYSCIVYDFKPTTKDFSSRWDFGLCALGRKQSDSRWRRVVVSVLSIQLLLFIEEWL